MPSAGLEPAITVSERPNTYALDRAATGTGTNHKLTVQNVVKVLRSKELLLCVAAH